MFFEDRRTPGFDNLLSRTLLSNKYKGEKENELAFSERLILATNFVIYFFQRCAFSQTRDLPQRCQKNFPCGAFMIAGVVFLISSPGFSYMFTIEYNSQTDFTERLHIIFDK